MFIDFFVSIILNADLVKGASLAALFVLVPLLLGFIFSLIHFQTRFKKLGAILWSILMFLIFGLVVGAFCRVQSDTFADDGLFALFMGSIVALMPLCLAASAMGRIFNRKKKLHWLVIPMMYGMSFLPSVVVAWCMESHPVVQYTEDVLSDEMLEKWKGFDFEIETPKILNYENIRLSIVGKGDSILYRVKYDLCPFDLNDKDRLTLLVDPLEENATPWTLLDKEKSSIALRLREALMTYDELGWSGAGDKLPCFNLEINDFQKRIRHFGLFCGYGKWHRPKVDAMEKMVESLWPSRETYTKYSFEQAEKACRESQNFTGD